MSSTINIPEVLNENDTGPSSAIKTPAGFSMFSFGSSARSDCRGYYNGPSPRDYSRPYCGVEFLIKLLQLCTTIICIGIYSEGSPLLEHSVTSMMFTFVVCGAFLIITTVIVIGFITNNAMPEILIRVFNILGFLLYFVAACVTATTFYAWNSRGPDNQDIIKNDYDSINVEYDDYEYEYSIYSDEKIILTNSSTAPRINATENNILPMHLQKAYYANAVLTTSIFLFLNSVFYMFDVCLNFYRIFSEIENVGKYP